MRTSLKIALTLSSLSISTSLFAQDSESMQASGFNNFLLRSPSIISPSQYHQVQRGRAEGFLGFKDGSSDPEAAGVSDVDTTGMELALGGFFSPNPDFVIGLIVDYASTEVEDIEANATEVSPSLTYNLTPMLALGLSAHIVNGSQDNADGSDDSINYSYFSIGFTAHHSNWEATLLFDSENEDNKPQNDSPQAWALHGRYHIMPPLTLGLSFSQRDYSAVEPAGTSYEDQANFGLHLESQLTPMFDLEFAFLAGTDVGGSKDTDSSEFVIMGQAQINPRIEVGARLSYLTLSGDDADGTEMRPGVYIMSVF